MAAKPGSQELEQEGHAATSAFPSNMRTGYYRCAGRFLTSSRTIQVKVRSTICYPAWWIGRSD